MNVGMRVRGGLLAALIMFAVPVAVTPAAMVEVGMAAAEEVTAGVMGAGMAATDIVAVGVVTAGAVDMVVGVGAALESACTLRLCRSITRRCGQTVCLTIMPMTTIFSGIARSGSMKR